MTIAAFRKPSLSVGARVVFGSALLLASLAAPAFQADSSTGRSATAPLMKGTTLPSSSLPNSGLGVPLRSTLTCCSHERSVSLSTV